MTSSARAFKKLRLAELARVPLYRTSTQGRPTSVPTSITCETTSYTFLSRIETIRKHKSVTFLDCRDALANPLDPRPLQIKIDTVHPTGALLHRGDIVQSTGPLSLSRTQQITQTPTVLDLRSPCLYPWNPDASGVHQRYISMLNGDAALFVRRAEAMRTIRALLHEHDFVEVETPLLHPFAGGAEATPFETAAQALSNQPLYLRIAPELALKKAVVGGLPRVFEIGKQFRNEGLSRKHQPEFTMLEAYAVGHTLEDMMTLTEQIFRAVGFDYPAPFKRISYADALAAAGQTTMDDETFSTFVEPHLIEPTFVTDIPLEMSPLAQANPEHPHLASRFEFFVQGMELANSYDELNDPIEQQRRFEIQGNAQSNDPTFLDALHYGLPPTVGYGLGLDRLMMLMLEKESIRDVIMFPMTKTHPTTEGE